LDCILSINNGSNKVTANVIAHNQRISKHHFEYYYLVRKFLLPFFMRSFLPKNITEKQKQWKKFHFERLNIFNYANKLML